MMHRQTDYGLDQIRAMLKEGESPSGKPAPGALCVALPNGLPIGMVLNEIGLIFLAGGEEGKRAEEDLLKIQTSDSEKKRQIAYFYFARGRRQRVASPEALKKITAFERARKNKRTVLLVQNRLTEAAL